MGTENVNLGCNVGLVKLLTIVFVVLKLTDNIDWSWWWVFSPIWIPIVVLLVVLTVLGLLAIVVALID